MIIMPTTLFGSDKRNSKRKIITKPGNCDNIITMFIEPLGPSLVSKNNKNKRTKNI
jgi:hypothetical protein